MYLLVGSRTYLDPDPNPDPEYDPDPESDPELITDPDPDPNLQIISDLAGSGSGSGCTTLHTMIAHFNFLHHQKLTIMIFTILLLLPQRNYI